MIRKSLTVLLCLLAAGCTVTAELGAGINDNFYGGESWDNAGAIGFNGAVRGTRQLSDRWTGFCEYRHLSHWNAGWPFNDARESSVDHIGCGTSFRITEK